MLDKPSTFSSNDSSFNNTEESLLRDSAPPPTIWTKFVKKYKWGKLILVLSAGFGMMMIMFTVLYTLDVFHNKKYQSRISFGVKHFPGTSSGQWYNQTKIGSGEGTYYDPGVGLTACGTLFTAMDDIVAMNAFDFDVGETDNPNESPLCGMCITISGPKGEHNAVIQDICPKSGCGQGSIDLTPSVFNKIGNLLEGRIPVQWKQCQ